jgi:hypothetical protein
MTLMEDATEPVEMVVVQYKLPRAVVAAVQRSARLDRRLLREQVSVLLEEALAQRSRRARTRVTQQTPVEDDPYVEDVAAEGDATDDSLPW